MRGREGGRIQINEGREGITYLFDVAEGIAE